MPESGCGQRGLWFITCQCQLGPYLSNFGTNVAVPFLPQVFVYPFIIITKLVHNRWIHTCEIKISNDDHRKYLTVVLYLEELLDGPLLKVEEIMQCYAPPTQAWGWCSTDPLSSLCPTSKHPLTSKRPCHVVGVACKCMQFISQASTHIGQSNELW